MDYKELADEYGKVIRRKAKRIRMAKERLSILAMEILPEIESEEKREWAKSYIEHIFDYLEKGDDEKDNSYNS
ncbi:MULTISPECIES: hypothetical protein [Bacillus]|uniref:hypothetical protein n=1 Tax=Bacillus TaxID=1386 RepID=UPI000E4CA87C|nr:hypothetical protein [Bacillus sonorensis]MCF7618621.1 hypothetical protein [Bacillus sonorensis]MCY7858847.1 hypothetical protein [Bacillus sonorensis]MCY8034084.1 hypothetical protein [Bacillus sonorensis]MCY8565627.1 hypothetical protein [Bacillus sonorensis]MEC1437287.1 hypothetical protein [Bacillus sonorensis]